MAGPRQRLRCREGSGYALPSTPRPARRPACSNRPALLGVRAVGGPAKAFPSAHRRLPQGRAPPLADPDTARDFVYVADVIDAILLVANATTFEPGAVYNVGSGHQATLREVVALARDELDVRAEPAWGSGEHRSWDTATWVADASRIRSELGWRPRHSLQEGFRATVDWLRCGEAPTERYGVSS